MNRVLASIIVALATAQLQAQTAADSPKLIIGITVDQLRTDYLHMMQHVFGERGFKRLMNEGIMYDNVVFDFPATDRSSGTAAIYTGTTPSYNGIIANTRYNPATKRVESILYDVSKMGNYTHETVSPKNILTSTLCDELKIASDGLSLVYAIAPDYDQAIISGGHAANSVFWIDNNNGKWATTTHYKDIPWYVERFNIANSLSSRIDTMQWTPLYPIDRYTGLPYLSSDFLFRHPFEREREEKYTYFKSSGLVNAEVNRLVGQFLDNGALGKRQFPDFLNVGYSASNYRGKSIQEYSLEIQDTYLRLDREVARLLDMVDKKVGLDNTVIFLTSTGYFKGEGREPGTYNVPTGEFYPKRATALLNMYLMAIYGQGDWVEGYHHRQIYLNRKIITDQSISLEEIQTRAAEFLIQMTGVQDVVTSHQMLHGNWNNRIDRIRKGYHRKLSGDLLLEIQPGWDINFEEVNATHEYVRDNFIQAPLFFFGKNLKPQHIKREIKVTEIAPTVSRLLRIRSPNAAGSNALPEIER